MQMQRGVVEATKKTASSSTVSNISEDVSNSKDANMKRLIYIFFV